MASIEKQPSGRYRARYRDRNGRSRSQTFERKFDAQQFLDNASTDMQRGEWIDPKVRRQLFDDWADNWWATTVRLRPGSRRTYWGLLEGHVRPYFEGQKLAEIDYLDVERFISSRLNAGLSPKYVRSLVSVLALIFELAVKAKVRRDNPAAGHELAARRRKVRQGDVLDMAEAQRLIAQIKDPYKPAIWLLLLTGMRPSELCGLRVGSVDFARHMVHIVENLQPVQKFDEEPYRPAVTGPTKTEAGDRTIPIPQWLSDELAEILAGRAAKRGSNVMCDEYLFVTAKNKPLNRDRFRRDIVRPALLAAGLPETLRTYDLRHSHASLLIGLGADVLAVAQRMGHADAAVTLREYGHLFEGVQEKLTDQLDGLRMTTSETATAEVLPIAGVGKSA